MVASADLVLCATRVHRSHVVRVEPASLRYTFLLTEFADLASVISAVWSGATSKRAGASTLREWIAVTSALHRAEVAPRRGDAADIIDPFRRSDRVFNRMVCQVDEALLPIANLLRTAAASRTR